MKSIKDYSLIRLIIVACGTGIVVGAFGIIVRQVPAFEGWTSFLQGTVASLVILGTIAYFSTGNRDKLLLQKNHKE